jgi:hypothetical protein
MTPVMPIVSISVDAQMVLKDGVKRPAKSGLPDRQKPQGHFDDFFTGTFFSSGDGFRFLSRYSNICGM